MGNDIHKKRSSQLIKVKLNMNEKLKKNLKIQLVQKDTKISQRLMK